MKRNDCTLLKQVLKKERNYNLLYGLILIFSGFSLVFLLGKVNLSLLILLVILISILILIGSKFLLEAYQNWDIINHRIFKMINKNPKKIVWIYSIQTQLAPFGISLFTTGELFFKLDDGNQIIINAAASKLKLVSNELNSILPHTTFVYTAELDQWYTASPYLLLKH